MRNHPIRSPRAFALLAAVTLALPAGLARADETTRTVEGQGEAAIVNGDEAMAKERATKAALRDAVERTLGTIVVADSQTKDFQLVKDQILSTSQGYVSSYDMLETRRDGDAFVVRVKAQVSSGKINQDLAAKKFTVRQMHYPRMALLIAEQSLGDASPRFWWGSGGQGQGAPVAVDQRLVENQLIDDWSEAGFTFVDMEALAGKLKAARVVSTNPSADEVRQIANLSDADVIVVGTAIATRQGDLGQLLDEKSGGVSMLSCKGSISARVFNADSGEILATSTIARTALHVDELVCGRNALIATAKAFADDLQGKLLDAWNRRIQGGSRVRMSVRGIDTFHSLAEFKNLLASNVRGVQGVEQKSFKDGAADLDVRLDGGDTEALAGDLDGRAVGRFKVRVVSMTSNTISIELAR